MYTITISTVFPFSSWALFSYASIERPYYKVKIIKIDNQELSEKKSVYDFKNKWVRGIYSPDRLIDRMALAKKNNNIDAFEKFRSTFETNYLSNFKQVSYKLVIENWNTLERFNKTGQFLSSELLYIGEVNNAL